MSVETYEESDEDRVPLVDEEEDEFGDTATDRARARTMGWKPRGVSHVSDEEFVGAKEFIRRGEASLPMLRRNNRDLSARLAKAEGAISEFRNTVTEQKAALEAAMALARRADNAGYQRGLRELKAKQREAVANGDTEAFDQIDEQIDAMQTEREKVTEEPPKPKNDPPPPPAATTYDFQNPNHPAYAEFYRENPWFNADKDLREDMTLEHTRIVRKSPTMPLVDQLETAKAAVMRLHPDKFGDPPEPGDDELDNEPQRRPPASVQRPRSTSTVPPRRRGVGFDVIADPAERAQAQVAFNSIKRQFPDYTVEEYLETYQDPHNDVLEQIARKKK